MHRELAKYIDHTLLKAEARKEDIERLCREALEHGFHSVCVNPDFVPLAHAILEGSGVKVCTVVGFPLGANEPAVKAYEAALAVKEGAEEVDMVINVSQALDGDFEYLEREIAEVRKAVPNALLKVIIETCYLDDRQKEAACLAAKRAKADFVKTSTGFGKGGATKEDVALMRKTVGPEMGVKASGGIHSAAEALDMIKAGATRLGTSASLKIVDGD